MNDGLGFWISKSKSIDAKSKADSGEGYPSLNLLLVKVEWIQIMDF